MLWHNGDVYDAVSKVKAQETKLFVSIRDENTSQIYIEMLEKSTELHGILKDSICLNLLKESDEYKQFSDVYKVTEIPSIFIISHEGQIVEIINNLFDEKNLCLKLREIFCPELKEIDISNEFQSSTNSEENIDTMHNVPSEDKMIEVRRLLAEKQRQKAEEDKEKEKMDELKRRDVGRQLHQLKQTQKEREDEEIKAELKRRKTEEKEARDKILRQIEEDKLERKQKYANQNISKPMINSIDETLVTNRNANTEAGVRFLFRFPDGSSVNHKFNNDDKFSIVRQFVADYIRDEMGCFDQFEIRQFFPRQTISSKDDSASLIDLKLVPSASFAVLFINKSNKNSTQVSNVVNWVTAPVNYLYLTIIFIFQWIKLKFTRSEPQNSNSTVIHPSSSNWEERQKRLLAAQSRTITKDGNLAGFSDAPKKNDDDEDEARWNGNSTQQM